MHIPDGYLSPSTCATLYAASAPFWWTALRRMKAHLNTRMVPLLSAFAAFSFVIMMFNLPLPGGTTGHAVGMGIASVVLGPWASMLAISIALMIQAVFFGDGGITAIGANCFNMAILGSLTAYGVYRLIAGGSEAGSTRRVLAAGLAGYAAINVSALAAAIEFGVQPLWFHDASGAPLYAPYPLRVAIPAMMIGHLTLAGLAEFIISAGTLRYLQKADPALLGGGAASSWTARQAWAAVGVLVLLTPLGILAAGSAWGEWSAADFADTNARGQIAVASGNQAPPVQAPSGLRELSNLWTAPLARYAPAWAPSERVGYFLSAAAGVGLILLLGLVATRLLKRPERRNSFVEKTIVALLDTARYALFAEETARAKGLLQSVDARVKVVGMTALIVAAVSVRRMDVLLGLLGVGVALALLSKVPLSLLAGRIWLAVLAFTGVIAIPAIFLTPGSMLFQVPLLGWIVTQQGLRTAAFLVLRAETSATLGVLLVMTTLWPQLLKSLRSFRVPVVAVVILGMTYRYIFLFLQTAGDMFESRKARLVGELEPADRRRLASGTAGVLLSKSLQLSGDVHTAMLARGFRGEVYILEEPQIQAADWLRFVILLSIACAAIWVGR
jgi:cobalt/nickel transport system permease protein